jgi:hypothetical protein
MQSRKDAKKKRKNFAPWRLCVRIHFGFILFVLTRRCSPFKGGGMDIAGEVDRALAVDGIPAGRIGRAEILDFQSDLNDGRFKPQVPDPFDRLPGRAAGGTADDPHLTDATVDGLDLKLGGPEFLSIPSQTNLPGQAASGRGCQDMRAGEFPTRGNHGYIPLTADQCQVMGQVRMRQKVENQIGPDLCGQVRAGVFDERGQRFVDDNPLQREPAPSVLDNSPDLGFSRAVLLKYEDCLLITHGYVFPGIYPPPPGRRNHC